MKFEILKCKLKPEARSGIFIDGNRRYHDIPFEIKKPGSGVQKNVEVYCDVEVVEMTQSCEIETEQFDKKNTKHDPVLFQFAIDCWDLAVELEAKVADLSSSAVEEDKKIGVVSKKAVPTKKRTRKG